MHTKSNVLFIFFQTSSKANGGLNSLAEIILNLNNIEPIVLTQIHSEFTQRLESKGVKVVVNPVNNHRGISFRRIQAIVKFSKFCQKIITEYNIKSVHVNDIGALIFISPLLFFLKNFTTIFNIRDVHEPHKPYGKVWRLVRYCKKILVLSNEMEKELINRLPIKEKIELRDKFKVTYSVVDFDRFYPLSSHDKIALQKKLGFSQNFIHCVFAATFNDKKNQLRFIKEALPLIKKSNIFIHFVGDFDVNQNPYALECLKALDADLQENINFHGYHSDIELFYQASDITLVPTKREGLARCMIESISCGTPVVSFDVSSAIEILEGSTKCGKVIPQGDYAQMVKELQKIVSNKELYTLYSKQGVALSRKLFSKDKVVDKYENAYLL